jgi:RHS repeat-associated protein
MLYDPQGSCVGTAAGLFQKPLFWDAYGKPVWTYSGDARAFNQPLQYKGQFGYYADSDAGLFYCLHRYYDPRSGKWISRDPAGLEGGVNVYEYCEDNPVMNVDPSGLYEIVYAWSRVLLGRYHSFLLIRDNVPGSPTFGQRWAIDATPEDGHHGIKALWNCGLLTDRSGWYGTDKRGVSQADLDNDPQRPDGTLDPFKGFVLDTNTEPVMPLLTKIKAMRDGMRKLPIEYHWSNSSSNSFTGVIMKGLGYSLDVVRHHVYRTNLWTPDPWFPGLSNDPWDHYLHPGK